MALTRTWNARIDRWTHSARTAAIVAVSASSALGAAAGIKVFLVPDRPDIAAVAQRVGNQQDQIGGFASDFVVTWLTATATQRAALQRFVALPETGFSLPITPAAVVTSPRTMSVIHAGAIGDTDTYAATVAVTERPYASAESTRSFYLVPISMWNHQPRAVTFPARINGPGPGVDVKLAYRQPLANDTAVYALVRGFLDTYLTKTSGLDRYAAAGSGLTPIGGYRETTITSLACERAVPAEPAPGAQVHVLATLVAQTDQFATVTLTYPLTVENSGGTWVIAAIDLTPQIADTDPEPIAPRGN